MLTTLRQGLTVVASAHMTIDANRPRGTESDSLMTQIHADNVVAVHALLAAQAGRMREILEDADWMRDLPLPGEDPISRDAKDWCFQPKVNQILDVHWAHYYEVQEAADRLREAARQYGHTEADVEAAFAAQRVAFAQQA